MKKILAITISFALLLTFAACSGGRPVASGAASAASSPEAETPSEAASTPEDEADAVETEPPTESGASGGESVVYMTTDISPAGIMAVYDALGVELTGDNIAVKLSTGEPPASNYLDPDLIRDVVEEVNGTIVECNTAYGGSRSETAMHYQEREPP